MAVHTQAATNVRDDWKAIKPIYYLSTSLPSKLCRVASKQFWEQQLNISVTHLDVHHASSCLPNAWEEEMRVTYKKNGK
jgi:hypothetical protein